MQRLGDWQNRPWQDNSDIQAAMDRERCDGVAVGFLPAIQRRIRVLELRFHDRSSASLRKVLSRISTNWICRCMVERAEPVKQRKLGFKYEFLPTWVLCTRSLFWTQTFRNGELVLVSSLNLSGNPINLYG